MADVTLHTRAGYGVWLRGSRLKAHMTQAQVAQAVGVGVYTVMRWEAGTSAPTLEHQAAIQTVFRDAPTVDAPDGEGLDPRFAHIDARFRIAERRMERLEEALADVIAAVASEGQVASGPSGAVGNLRRSQAWAGNPAQS